MYIQEISDVINIAKDTISGQTVNDILNTLNSMRDSLHAITPRVNAAVEHTNPAPWTYISLGVALAGLLASVFAVWFSSKTAKNVGRVAKDTQQVIMEDLVRHLYRNMVCTIAIYSQLKDNTGTHPSEDHLLKLKTLPEDIHLDRYNHDAVHYAKMHELGLLLRNYNTEIDVALTHLNNPKTEESVRHNDMRTLLFKPLYLIYRITDVMNIVSGNNHNENIIKILLSEHLNKLDENLNLINETKKKCEVWVKKMDEILKEEILKDEDNKINKVIDKLANSINLDLKKVLNNNNKFLTYSLRNKITNDQFYAKLASTIIFCKENTDQLDIQKSITNALSVDVMIEYPKIKLISLEK